MQKDATTTKNEKETKYEEKWKITWKIIFVRNGPSIQPLV